MTFLFCELFLRTGLPFIKDVLKCIAMHFPELLFGTIERNDLCVQLFIGPMNIYYVYCSSLFWF